MNDSTTICTVRHAQTDYGVQRRYAGWIDVPLSRQGVEDTKRASRKLMGRKFDVVITSALKRSIETASLLLGEDVRPVKCSCCNERNYGVMQGLTEGEVKLIEPRVTFIEVGNDYHSLNPPQGETFQMLRERAEKLLRFVFENYRGRTVLVISHGVFLQQFHGLIRGLDWKQSLATNVQLLEFNTFHFRDTLLNSHSARKLVERDQNTW